jgi:molecular chaperone DnaJ
MDFYVILGVERGATTSDIKRAYRRLSRRLHPHINPGDGVAAAEFRRIVEAYETLIDPDRRRVYDVQGPSDPPTEAASFEFDGFDFSISVAGASAPTFGDLFGDVLHQRAAQRATRVERGSDLYQSLTLTFDEAFRGGRHDLLITRRDACPTCAGAGRLTTDERRCQYCQGAGIVRSTRGHMVFSKPCTRCLGLGRRADAICSDCAGQQTVSRSETVGINVPAGLADGAQVRVAGKGHAGRNGGGPGDLLIAIQVQAHPFFRREGTDLSFVLPLAIHEAAFGATVDVPAPDGTARLRVPPGTQSGDRLRMAGRGLPSPRDGRRGDLIVEVRLALPEALDERSKQLLREFGSRNDAAGIRPVSLGSKSSKSRPDGSLV